MSKKNKFINFNRLFSMINKCESLPFIKKNLFQEGNKPYQIEFMRQLEKEYQENPYCGFMKNVDYLVESGLLTITTKSLSDIQASFQTTEKTADHIDKRNGYYDVHNQTIVIASDPSQFEKFTSTTDLQLHEHVSSFIHETCHGIGNIIWFDRVVGRQKRVKELTGMKSFDEALSVDYFDDNLDKMKQALIKDFKVFFSIADDDSHQFNSEAKWLRQYLKNIANVIDKEEILFEFKADFTELTMRGSVGKEKMEAFFPQFSKWYLKKYLQICNEKVANRLSDHDLRNKY